MFYELRFDLLHHMKPYLLIIAYFTCRLESRLPHNRFVYFMATPQSARCAIAFLQRCVTSIQRCTFLWYTLPF